MRPADGSVVSEVADYSDVSDVADSDVSDAADDSDVSDPAEEAGRISVVGVVVELLHLAAVAYLTTCLMLTGWTMLPLAAGWDAAVITTGSMQPTIRPGDVVVYDHPDLATLKAGQVILFTDPAHPSRQLTHRIRSIRPDGKIITKGDANHDADTAPVPRQNVHGRGRLVAPYVGRIALWNTPNARTAHLWLASIILSLGTLGMSSAVKRRRNGDPTDEIDPAETADRDPDPWDLDAGVPAMEPATVATGESPVPAQVPGSAADPAPTDDALSPPAAATAGAAGPAAGHAGSGRRTKRPRRPSRSKARD